MACAGIALGYALFWWSVRSSLMADLIVGMITVSSQIKPNDRTVKDGCFRATAIGPAMFVGTDGTKCPHVALLTTVSAHRNETLTPLA